MYSHQCRCHGRRHHTFRWSGFEAFNQIAVLVMDASICTIEAGKNAYMVEYYTAIGRPPV
jgi:hypothetical protein